MSNEEIINVIENKIVEKRKEKGTVKNVKGIEISYDNVEILSPIVRGRKGEYYQLLYDMLSKGYTESYVDGEKHNLREKITLEKNKKHNISVLVDSIGVDEILKKTKDAKTRLSEAIEHAIHESSGLVEFNLYGESTVMSTQFACSNCGFSFPEVEPRLFSFNSPYGACPTCNGLGVKYIGALDDCEDCGGKRLRKEALNVFLGTGGNFNNNIDNRLKLLPKSLQSYLSTITEDLTKIIPDLLGIYLYGSITYGDFREKSSDVDLVIITKNSIVKEVYKKLEKYFESSKNEWAKRSEIDFVIEKDVLNYKSVGVHFSGGKLKNDFPADSSIVNTWINLYDQGINLYGPEPRKIIPEISVPERIKSFRETFDGLRKNIPTWIKENFWNQVYITVVLAATALTDPGMVVLGTRVEGRNNA
jgi:predicted nucleotidyltransferase